MPKTFRNAFIIALAKTDPREAKKQVLRAHSKSRTQDERRDLISAMSVLSGKLTDLEIK